MGCACCVACGDKRAAIDPAARLLAARGVPHQIGNVLPDVVWPSDVEKLKNRLDPQMVSTDAAVTDCVGLSDSERKAWKIFYAAWRAFYAEPVPWLFGSSPQWDNAKTYEAQLAGWQEQLRKKCAIPGPVVKPDEGPDLSGLKWASAAVIVVATVYGVTRLL